MFSLHKSNNFLSICNLSIKLLEKSICDNCVLKYPLGRRMKFALSPEDSFIKSVLRSCLISQSRYKHGKRRQIGDKSTEEDEGDTSLKDEVIGKGAETKTNLVGSMRADLMLKVGLGIARNKVETAFYESRVRVNSMKIAKKSATVQIGDEVDIVKGPSPSNPKFILVGRVEILDARPSDEDDGIYVKYRRSKSLIVENYPDGDPWKPSEAS